MGTPPPVKGLQRHTLQKQVPGYIYQRGRLQTHYSKRHHDQRDQDQGTKQQDREAYQILHSKLAILPPRGGCIHAVSRRKTNIRQTEGTTRGMKISRFFCRKLHFVAF